jgi:hypothetical protein
LLAGSKLCNSRVGECRGNCFFFRFLCWQ